MLGKKIVSDLLFPNKIKLNRKVAALKRVKRTASLAKGQSGEWNHCTVFCCVYFVYTVQPQSKNVNHLDTEAWVCGGLTDLNHLRKMGRDQG